MFGWLTVIDWLTGWRWQFYRDFFSVKEFRKWWSSPLFSTTWSLKKMSSWRIAVNFGQFCKICQFCQICLYCQICRISRKIPKTHRGHVHFRFWNVIPSRKNLNPINSSVRCFPSALIDFKTPLHSPLGERSCLFTLVHFKKHSTFGSRRPNGSFYLLFSGPVSLLHWATSIPPHLKCLRKVDWKIK